ncbi:fatty acid desaturase [Denitrobaculum tricleocarpae]|uniref:Fatty acid desaturase n=1 Tax=Denitrobaculum tricleocarpae TaxID=2591009 RepID=A0A545U2J3_9PROT|nr:fatty acid desaturase [Denitrobaculum tricleocarpae]TQV83654.1 fatty acid desaturase [Denitrobaculum tricleocarpae]
MPGVTDTAKTAPRQERAKAQTTMQARRKTAIEWPTLGLGFIIYGGFGLLTWHYHSLPWWLGAAIGIYLIAWHGSLQHEVTHGHPTAWRRVNEAFVFPSLWLWIPYGLYRSAHLKHHCDARLTDPLEDPESYYLTPRQWAEAGRAARILYLVNNSFLGRLLFGPAICIWRLYKNEALQLIRGDGRNLGTWGLHALSCVAVLCWVVAVCQIPLTTYLVLFVYPAVSLSLVRSFAEHRAHPDVEQRSVIVESRGPMALLFLNNNLHALHHAEPALPWYQLPARFKARRSELLTANGGYRFSGYGEIMLRYMLWPKEHVRHPFGRALTARAPKVAAPAPAAARTLRPNTTLEPVTLESATLEATALKPVSAA